MCKKQTQSHKMYVPCEKYLQSFQIYAFILIREQNQIKLNLPSFPEEKSHNKGMWKPNFNSIPVNTKKSVLWSYKNLGPVVQNLMKLLHDLKILS